MRVVSFGISLKRGHDKLSLAQLFAELESENGTSQQSQDIDRRYYIDDETDSEFIRGLVVTVRDQNAFCKLVESGPNFKIQVQNLADAERIMEFNLFVINKKNGFGIYQYYHRSCPPNTFIAYLKRRYRAKSQELRDVAIAAAEKKSGGSLSTKEKKSLRTQYAGVMKGGVLVRPDSLAGILDKYKDITGFSFELTSVEARQHAMGPLDPLARTVRQSVAFLKDASKRKITKAIYDFLDNVNPKTAKVSVLDDDEESFQIRVTNMPQNFGEYEYSEVASELQGLDVSKFTDTTIVLRLIKLCKKHKEIFMVNVQDEE
jgi:hypothetical protein